MLQAQAIDTLGVLARAIGNDNFRPLAPDCIELGKVSLICITSLFIICNYCIEYYKTWWSWFKKSYVSFKNFTVFVTLFPCCIVCRAVCHCTSLLSCVSCCLLLCVPCLLLWLYRYGMFASLSCVLGPEILPHLEDIIARMLESLSSTEGVKVPCLTIRRCHYYP